MYVHMQENVSTDPRAASFPGLSTAAAVSNRHNLDQLSLSMLSGSKARSLKLHRSSSSRSQERFVASSAGQARDSLAHISVNLPEAPLAFRHTPLTQSTSSHPHLHTDRQGRHADVLSVSGLESNAAGALPMSTRVGRQQSTGKMHSAVTVSLPESPKRAVVRKQTAHRHAEFADGLKSGTQAQAGVEGLFSSALLDVGPPRLGLAGLNSSSSLVDTYAAGTDAGADLNVNCDRAGVVIGSGAASVPAAGAVAFPLHQSDFSR